MSKIKTAVITGRHPYDVPAFQNMFRSLENVEAYPQHLEEFVSDTSQSQMQFYDVFLFYNFHRDTPSDDGNWWEAGMKRVLEQLGQTSQGIFLLHHAILAFPEWEHWQQISGITESLFGYHLNQQVRTEVADASHPITYGLDAWEMMDETYTVNGPVEGSNVLLTTDHPKSMKALGWTRTYQKAPVFCYQGGHDNLAYSDENFRRVVERGIQWLAGGLD